MIARIVRALSTARTHAPWIGVALLVGILACTPSGRPRHYFESFEELCMGVPCGWQRSSGTAEQATWVETIHPGEHGLRLTGEVSVRGEGSEIPSGATASLLLVGVVARCDPDSWLSVDLVLTDDLGNDIMGSAVLSPGREWTAPTVAAPTYTSTLTSDVVTRVVAIGITKHGAGSCEISELAIESTVGDLVC